MKSVWKDNPDRYGRLTRILHWAMAVLFAWQFFGMATKLALGRSPLTAFLVGTHVSVGTTLFVLMVLRVLWASLQRATRPPAQAGWKGRAAALGHFALYSLMVVVPTLAVLRQLGAGKGYRVFGIELLEPTGVAVEWMLRPAQMLHGLLAWVLLALIAGHVIMVVVHKWAWRDEVVYRMLGRSPR